MNRQICQDSSNKWPQRPAEFPQLMTPVVLPDGNGGFTPCPELMTEEELIAYLKERNIGSRPFYPAIHLQKPYNRHKGDYSVAEEIGSMGLWLPSSLGICDEETRFVVRAIRDFPKARKVRA